MVSVQVATSGAHLGKVAEDAWLVDALEAAGMSARLAVWDDPAERWRCDAVVVRSVWGYHHDLPGFLAWLDRLDLLGVTVLNPTGMIRANIDKVAQLSWLAAAGVPHVPTALLTADDLGIDLARLLQDRLPGERAVVLKPAVSASGHDTLLVGEASGPGAAGLRFASVEEARAMLREVLRRPDNRGVLAQPFLPGIARGEHAPVYLGGRFSHCFVRFPGVLGQRRESAHVEEPRAEHVRIAETALAGLTSVPAYARVDVLDGNDGPVVMEVELAEPFLGFALLPEPQRALALDRFVAAIAGSMAARQ